MKKWQKITIISISTFVLTIAIAFTLFVSNYYHADQDVVELAMEYEMIDHQMYIESSTPSDVGIIFYPGGKVEAIAYLPILLQLAEEGYNVVLLEMPFNLAFFKQNAADDVFENYPNINHWFISGHSLGGAMASSYASKKPDKVEGLILLGAYLYGTYPVENALTIYGTFNDNLEKNIDYDENIVIIEGGNHAQFGNYGKQKGDPDATISALEQQEITVNAIHNFIKEKLSY